MLGTISSESCWWLQSEGRIERFPYLTKFRFANGVQHWFTARFGARGDVHVKRYVGEEMDGPRSARFLVMLDCLPNVGRLFADFKTEIYFFTITEHMKCSAAHYFESVCLAENKMAHMKVFLQQVIRVISDIHRKGISKLLLSSS